MFEGPVVFILEDGDNVLTPRGKENLSLISTLLNFTSGILGSMLDIRAIATTNSPTKDIDPALMRPGRLSAHVTVGPLSTEQAIKIFKRLTGKKDGVTHATTLAQVYRDARKAGWEPPQQKNGSRSVRAYAENDRAVSSRVLGEEILVYPGKGQSYL